MDSSAQTEIESPGFPLIFAHLAAMDAKWPAQTPRNIVTAMSDVLRRSVSAPLQGRLIGLTSAQQQAIAVINIRAGAILGDGLPETFAQVRQLLREIAIDEARLFGI